MQREAWPRDAQQRPLWARCSYGSRRLASLSFLGGLALLVAACSKSEATSGVENLWRDPAFSVVEGVTTDADILAALGPPSQIINLQDERVFYYLKEVFRSERLLLIVYNTAKRSAQYDRAVFFFDNTGVLKKAAFSRTALPKD